MTERAKQTAQHLSLCLALSMFVHWKENDLHSRSIPPIDSLWKQHISSIVFNSFQSYEIRNNFFFSLESQASLSRGLWFFVTLYQVDQRALGVTYLYYARFLSPSLPCLSEYARFQGNQPGLCPERTDRRWREECETVAVFTEHLYLLLDITSELTWYEEPVSESDTKISKLFFCQDPFYPGLRKLPGIIFSLTKLMKQTRFFGDKLQPPWR